MRRFLIASLCLLVLVAGLVSTALAQTLEDKVTEFELDNGMKFIVVERHEAPVAFCAVAFKVGAIYERPGITGISHLLEHMLFKGTETIGTKDYKAEKLFLDREDALAEEARDLRLEIEPWRLEFFDEPLDRTDRLAERRGPRGRRVRPRARTRASDRDAGRARARR